MLWSIEYAVALCLKNVHNLVKKCFIAKKCQPSSEQSALLVEGLTSMLAAADLSVWWLLKVGVIVAIS